MADSPSRSSSVPKEELVDLQSCFVEGPQEYLEAVFTWFVLCFLQPCSLPRPFLVAPLSFLLELLLAKAHFSSLPLCLIEPQA